MVPRCEAKAKANETKANAVHGCLWLYLFCSLLLDIPLCFKSVNVNVYVCVCISVCVVVNLWVALVMRAFKTWISLYRRPLTRKKNIYILNTDFSIICSLYWDYFPPCRHTESNTHQKNIYRFSFMCIFHWIFLFLPIRHIIIFFHSSSLVSTHLNNPKIPSQYTTI